VRGLPDTPSVNGVDRRDQFKEGSEGKISLEKSLSAVVNLTSEGLNDDSEMKTSTKGPC